MTTALQDLPLWLDALLSALLLIGAAFALVGAIGLVRLPDFYLRLHAPSKATTAGVGCVLLASAIGFAALGDPGWAEVWVAAFLFATAPVSALLLVRAVRLRGGG